MPSLDDSSDYQPTNEGGKIQPTSPFIERNPGTYKYHVMTVLKDKKQIKFKELLPEGSTRKTAGIAFHHILSECINI